MSAVLNISSHLLLLVSSLILLAGCSVQQKEEDGDQEPKLGFYSVRVDPSQDFIYFSPEEQYKTIHAIISVECLGLPDLIPPDCKFSPPNWEATHTFPYRSIADIKIESPDRPISRVEIRIWKDGVELDHQENSLSGTSVSGKIIFTPRNVPKDLHLSGSRSLSLGISLPTRKPEKKEETPQDPVLEAYPNPLTFYSEKSRECMISYKGPRRELVQASVVGSGAGAFEVEILGGLPYPLSGKNNGPRVIVRERDSQIRGRATLVLKTSGFREQDTATARIELVR